MKMIIAIHSRTGGIGKDNKLSWHSKEDLEHFRKLTTKVDCDNMAMVIVGHNTYESMPKSVLSCNDRIFIKDKKGVLLYIKNAWVAGGLKTYKKYMHLCKEFHISFINSDNEANDFDTFYRHKDIIKDILKKCGKYHVRRYFFEGSSIVK